MSSTNDHIVAIGLIVALNTLKLLESGDQSLVKRIVSNLNMSSVGQEATSGSNAVYTGLGVLTVGQIMLSVYGLDRLDAANCKQITNERVRSGLYVGSVVAAFLLPEFIFHSTRRVGAGELMSPTNGAKLALGLVLGTSALATLRSGWHFRTPLCSKGSVLWQTWFFEGLIALTIAVVYAGAVVRG